MKSFLYSLMIGCALSSSVGVVSPPSAYAAKAQEKAICGVCGPREGAGPEPVKATATYKGKNYSFCSLNCKAEFLQNPNEFLITDEGKPAPAFTLKDLQGKNVSLADYKGKVVLADFWGTFCVPCVKALPELQALHQKYGPKGFAVIGVSVDEKPSQVAPVIKKAKATYPMLMATPKVWSAYKVSALPALVLIGRDGKIIKRYGGEADKKAMIAQIERALEVPTLLGKTE
jgi:peroxiredoxin